MQGVVLISLGNPNYGRMAVALAATIRAASNIPITIFHDGVLDGIREKPIFDSVKLSSEEYTLKGEPRYLRPKLLLDEISPYDETIYLDVDMVWMGGSIEALFAECANTDFNMKNYGHSIIKDSINDERAWFNFSDAMLMYKLSEQKNYHLSSECIYFKKTKEVKKLFQLARKVFDNPKIPFKDFAGYVADEMAFAIAMMQTEKYPTIENWQPVFWRQSNKTKFTIQNIREQFHAMSMGGSRATEQERQVYNNIVAAAYYKLGILHPYQWVNKYRFLKERSKI